MKLTERQIDLLKSLAFRRDKPGFNSRNLTSDVFPPEVRGYWSAPMDFGGTDGSHHSATAKQLAKKKLIDRYKNGQVNAFNSRNKCSCCYRINDAGIAALTQEQPHG